MSERNNWEANGDFSIHPIMRCNNCNAVFQGPHKCEYDDLMSRNKELRMELYDLKMDELIAGLVKSFVDKSDDVSLSESYQDMTSIALWATRRLQHQQHKDYAYDAIERNLGREVERV